MDKKLPEVTFTNKKLLADNLGESGKDVLLIIPAISVGKSGLNDQYKDYSDQAAILYTYLISQNFYVDIFVLGAEHRGDGFLHKTGADYLIQIHKIPQTAIVWKSENFQKVGLCSVEEAQLTAQFINEPGHDYQILTSVSKSQFKRYFLHQQGYGIMSVYFIFPDNSAYYHLQNQDQEDLLVKITEKDPKWESEIGTELRRFTHRLRDPKEPDISPEEVKTMQNSLKEFVRIDDHL